MRKRTKKVAKKVKKEKYAPLVKVSNTIQRRGGGKVPVIEMESVGIRGIVVEVPVLGLDTRDGKQTVKHAIQSIRYDSTIGKNCTRIRDIGGRVVIREVPEIFAREDVEFVQAVKVCTPHGEQLDELKRDLRVKIRERKQKKQKKL